jgi:hypothetical protein
VVDEELCAASVLERVELRLFEFWSTVETPAYPMSARVPVLAGANEGVGTGSACSNPRRRSNANR